MSEENLQRYYKSCHEYFSKLQEKEFKTWFSKYYKFLGANRKEGLILDVGCGVGQVVAKIAEDGSECVGIDISPIAIKTATRESSENINAFFVVASGYHLPFKQETFNTVGCFDTLEHLNNPRKCLDEMLRVLNPKGTIIVASPNLLCPIYAKGLEQKILSLEKLFSKIIEPDAQLNFEHVKPKLDWSGKEVGKDLDATTLVDPITIKKILKNKKVKIIYQSSYLGSKQSIEKLSTLPFFRSVGGGIFIAGKKEKMMHVNNRSSEEEKSY